MTHDDAVAEVHAAIAMADALHREDPIERRQRQKEAERQDRRQQEVRDIEQQAANAANSAAWDAWFERKFFEVFRTPEMIDMWGELHAHIKKEMRKEYTAKITVLENRIKELEHQASLDQRFFELERRLDARSLARERGSEIPQGELLEKIETLKRQIHDLEWVADLDAHFRELADRVGALEQTNSFEARFAELAHEVKSGSEMVPHSELLVKFEKLQSQIDDLERVADLDARFRELAERVGEIEKTNSLDTRFNELAKEVKHGAEIPQSELLAGIDGLQRQIDDLKRVADLDSRFLELTDRVSELEKMNGLEARFTKLADEVKNRSEIPQSELLARIDRLERQLDDLKRIPGQSGPPGPPGKDGELPIVKVFQKDTVYYTGDVVICDGSTYQALRDTGQSVNHADWVCLARAGRNGSDGRSPNVCGAYDAHEKYDRLDIVALDGAAFIARKDDPGICPGDGWQLLSRQGQPGHRGETGERGARGEKGERGEPGATVVSWQLDRQRYRVSPLMSDGKVGPALELRALFEQYHAEACQ